jgi:U4/U6.U5 tri-snRNP-associated protein 1
MDEGDARILTLKDSRILDNEGALTRLVKALFIYLTTLYSEDELQNVEMAEEEKTKKRNEMKIKKRDYKGYDDDEFTADNGGMKRAVLAKYDEDIEGTRDTVSGLKLFSAKL